MKIKTSELVGAALDCAVAKCEGLDYWQPDIGPSEPAYSTDWSQAGPIIEREWLDLTVWPCESNEEMRWMCDQYDAAHLCRQYGPTPLIAAMRCYVALRFGDEVDVPDELVCGNTVHS